MHRRCVYFVIVFVRRNDITLEPRRHQGKKLKYIHRMCASARQCSHHASIHTCNRNRSIDDRDRRTNKHLPSTENASEAITKFDTDAHEGARPVLYMKFAVRLLASSVDMVDHPSVIEHISPCPIAAHSTSSKQANQTIRKYTQCCGDCAVDFRGRSIHRSSPTRS